MSNNFELDPTPIALFVHNTTTDAKKVDLFCAAKNINSYVGKFNEDGGFAIDGVTIESMTSSDSYRDILYMTLSRVYRVRTMYIKVIDGDPEKLSRIMLYKRKDGYGTLISSPFYIRDSAIAARKDVFELPVNYTLDVFSEIEVGLPAGMKIELRFYFEKSMAVVELPYEVGFWCRVRAAIKYVFKIGKP